MPAWVVTSRLSRREQRPCGSLVIPDIFTVRVAKVTGVAMRRTCDETRRGLRDSLLVLLHLAVVVDLVPYKRNITCMSISICTNINISISIMQGGRTWQPFVGSKNGNENFRQARIYNFRVKCVVFARNRKFAKLTQ